MSEMSVRNRFQDILLLAITVSFAPVSICLLLVNYLYLSLFPRRSIRRRLRTNRGFVPKTVLLTGVNTPQGLRLARAFHDTGHNVIGLDYEPGGLPIPPRLSKAVHTFYAFKLSSVEGRRSEYVNFVTEIIEKEHADLWLNCITSADPLLEAQAKKWSNRQRHVDVLASALTMPLASPLGRPSSRICKVSGSQSPKSIR